MFRAQFPWPELRATLLAFKEEQNLGDADLCRYIDDLVRQMEGEHTIPNRVTLYRLLAGKTFHPTPDIHETLSLVVKTQSFGGARRRHLGPGAEPADGQGENPLGDQILDFVRNENAAALDGVLAALFPPSAEDQNRATWLVRACAVCVQHGEHAAAQTFARRALEEAGLPPGRREQLRILRAQICLGTCDFEPAIRLCEEFLAQQDRPPDIPPEISILHQGVALAVAGKARLALEQEDVQVALSQLKRAERLLLDAPEKDLRLTSWVAAARAEAQARVLTRSADSTRAVPVLDALSSLIEEHRRNRTVPEDARSLATAYLHEGKVRIALRLLRRGRADPTSPDVLTRSLRLAVREGLGEMASVAVSIHENDLLRSFLKLRREAMLIGLESPIRPEGDGLCEAERRLRSRAAMVDPNFVDW